MDVVMPQLGETVTEGTITRWFKQVGDSVAADEPLFEVSTDKVDSEVPSPTAGTITEIRIEEGDTVDVGTVLAVIGDAAESPAAEPRAAEPVAETPAPEAPAPEREAPASEPAVPAATPEAPPAEREQAPAPPPEAPGEQVSVHAVTAAASAPAPVPAGVVVSPIVRRLMAEHGLDPSDVTPTGEGGRITRSDVLAAAQARRETAPASPPPGARAAEPPSPRRAGVDETVPFDNIRRLTAEHMVRSKATSAHVYTSVEVDFERVERTRRSNQAEWKAREGFSLTYLPFIARALCDAIDQYPHVNSSVDSDALVVHGAVNLGIAVDLDFGGLVAPVVRNAEGKRLRLLAQEMRDLATRARSKRLTPDEIVGGTFTVTNMGPFDTHMTLPIINQPQVAILATDGIRKRPVVVEGPDGEDTIAVHHTGFLTLTWDHRAFDGAYAASFLADMRDTLESRDWNAELA